MHGLKYELDIKLCAKFKWGILCAAEGEGEVIHYAQCGPEGG